MNSFACQRPSSKQSEDHEVIDAPADGHRALRRGAGDRAALVDNLDNEQEADQPEAQEVLRRERIAREQRGMSARREPIFCRMSTASPSDLARKKTQAIGDQVEGQQHAQPTRSRRFGSTAAPIRRCGARRSAWPGRPTDRRRSARPRPGRSSRRRSRAPRATGR